MSAGKLGSEEGGREGESVCVWSNQSQNQIRSFPNTIEFLRVVTGLVWYGPAHFNKIYLVCCESSQSLSPLQHPSWRS